MRQLLGLRPLFAHKVRGPRLAARNAGRRPALQADVFSRLRPSVPRWLPGWLDAELVVIELDGAGSVAEDADG